MTNGTKIVFDTCAVIKLPGGKCTSDDLGINIDEALQFVSVITRMELLAKPDLPVEEEQDIKSFLSEIVVLALDEKVENIAVEIRRQTKLKLPDCIVAATAIALNAVPLSNDAGLLSAGWPMLVVKQV